MTRANLRYLSNEAIEDVTAQRIRQYEAKAGVTVGFPVPAEEVIEQVLGLCFLWDQIAEQPGEMILGGLSRKLPGREERSGCRGSASRPFQRRGTCGCRANVFRAVNWLSMRLSQEPLVGVW